MKIAAILFLTFAIAFSAANFENDSADELDNLESELNLIEGSMEDEDLMESNFDEIDIPNPQLNDPLFLKKAFRKAKKAVKKVKKVVKKVKKVVKKVKGVVKKVKKVVKKTKKVARKVRKGVTTAKRILSIIKLLAAAGKRKDEVESIEYDERWH